MSDPDDAQPAPTSDRKNDVLDMVPASRAELLGVLAELPEDAFAYCVALLGRTSIPEVCEAVAHYIEAHP